MWSFSSGALWCLSCYRSHQPSRGWSSIRISIAVVVHGDCDTFRQLKPVFWKQLGGRVWLQPICCFAQECKKRGYMFTSFSKTTDVLWSWDRSSRAWTLPGETEPDRSETADSTPVRLAHKCRGSGGVGSDGQPNEEGATRQGVTTCAGGLGKWMSLLNFFVLLGQHGGVKQDAGVVPLLRVCDCQNRCKWRLIPCSSGLVDKAYLLQIESGSPICTPKQSGIVHPMTSIRRERDFDPVRNATNEPKTMQTKESERI